MTEGEKAGLWALVYLLMVGVTAYFTIFMVVFSFVKNCFGVK
jgi:type III secretory pathway component EscR